MWSASEREETGGVPPVPPRRRTSPAAAEAVGPARVQRTRLVRVPVCACVRNEAKFLTYLGERVRETASSSSLQSPSNRLPSFFFLSTPFDAPTWEKKRKKKTLAC